jgi:hypothetical protein
LKLEAEIRLEINPNISIQELYQVLKMSISFSLYAEERKHCEISSQPPPLTKAMTRAPF